ncbi:MAG: hydrogenase expression/formation protein HypE, partial [Coriobacteriia bacterium]|nr:hydrogenase expression/formation protein HypE [Coriobacteriia bacterium]
MMRELIADFFYEAYGSPELLIGDDSAVLELGLSADRLGSESGAPAERLAFTTDSFVVTPRFFPGGDIGRLAVCGTVNDLACSGATPLWLSLAFILEEGLQLTELSAVCASIATAATEAGVRIVTGDTKVVPHGTGDGVYINTAGVGLFRAGARPLSGRDCQPGDKILLSGSLGDHGIAIVCAREELGFASDVASDAAPLNRLVSDVIGAAPSTRCFRDPTRGGLASTINELAAQSQTSMTVEETAVPVHAAVAAVCAMLGYDVFQVANEGKAVAVVPADEADAALAAMLANPLGREAA